jgi:hypothetical protein
MITGVILYLFPPLPVAFYEKGFSQMPEFWARKLELFTFPPIVYGKNKNPDQF